VIQSEDHALRILRLYDKMQVPKEHFEVFRHHLLGRRDSYFLEVGDAEGLVQFTPVVPRIKAQFSVVFWDQKLSAKRRVAVKEAIVDAFKNFALIRVQADISAKNVPMKTFLQRLGFTYEGTLRSDWIEQNGLSDKLVYGILAQELK